MTTKAQTYNVDISDVEYLNHGGAPLLAKLFKPQGSGPFPIMLELHGGAWVRGGRENGDAANEALAKTGVIVAALDFRTQERYPASVADIHYAVRWAKSQAASWNGIPDSVGAMGTSSGAHQAMLLGMRPNDSRYAALPSPAGSSADGTLACVIMVSPVIDPLGRYLYAKGLRSDCTPPEGAPARILAAGEKTELPPTLALRRSYEAAHPRPDFDEFIDQYRKAGGPIDLTIFEGEGEGLLSDLSSDVGKQTLEEMGAFIHKHIG
jgi:acetyl esterase/lipase